MSKENTIISLLKEINKNIDNINDSGGINVNLKELTVTADGEYLPADYNADGFSKVTAEFDTSNLPKVKVHSFIVSNDCINDDGIWEGEDLIDTSACIHFQATFQDNQKIVSLNASNWDTSNISSIRWMFRNCTNLEEINVTGWDMSKVSNNAIGFAYMFCNTPNLKKIIGINSWKANTVSATYDNFFSISGIEELDLSGYKGIVGNANSMFYQCYSLHTLNISDLDVSQCNLFGYCFGLCYLLKELDLTKWDMSAAQDTTRMFFRNNSLISIVGGRNIDDVIANNIGVMNGVKQLSPSTFEDTQGLDRASLRALINGLADLTGQTTQTLTLGETLIAKLTEEDIAIATTKNWTIA